MAWSPHKRFGSFALSLFAAAILIAAAAQLTRRKRLRCGPIAMAR